jgi:exopolyphosphatase/guanosine-5'-triphosphate,3'-diphosphate pyrophosphatase
MVDSKTAAEAGAPSEVRPVAVIDIGSTAIRLRIAEIRKDGTAHSLEALQHAVHLGKDTFTLGHIQPSSIEECVKILRSFRRIMAEYGVTRDDQIRAVATSAVREAENRDAFLDRIYMATQINVSAIEGAEENRLTYIAVHDLIEANPSLKKSDMAIVEVGGGGTDFMVLQEGRVAFSESYRLGSLRMRETLETYRAPADRARAVLSQHIQRTIDQLRRRVPFQNLPYLVAVSGDARFAASLISPQWEKSHVCHIDVEIFRQLVDQLVTVPVDELVRKYRIPYQEAETIGPALLAYEHLADAFRMKHILVSRASMRDGLLKEMVVGGAWTFEFADQAIHSAMALADKYRVDEEHALHVADLSVRLFRELQPEHGLDARFELMLRIAGLLHEVGSFISDRSHHKHSMYIILNSDLFGLTKKDLTLIALVARYHRRASPRAYHTEYTSLERDSRLVVSKLAAILRLADALDCKHSQQVRHFNCQRTDGQFILTVPDVADLTLEQLSLKDKASLFNQVFGTKVVLRSALTADGTVLHERA